MRQPICVRERKENGRDEKQSKVLRVFGEGITLLAKGRITEVFRKAPPVPCGSTDDCLGLVADLFPLELLIQLLLPSTWWKISHFIFTCTDSGLAIYKLCPPFPHYCSLLGGLENTTISLGYLRSPQSDSNARKLSGWTLIGLWLLYLLLVSWLLLVLMVTSIVSWLLWASNIQG